MVDSNRQMESTLAIPSQVPVMTLRDTVFFPHSVIPLYIFEPRYREMLEDVLQGNRMFALAKEDGVQAEVDGSFEPMHRFATVGIVRASHKNDDGTSNLVLQGLVRVRIVDIVEENPYRIAEIEPVSSEPGAAEEALMEEKSRVAHLLSKDRSWQEELPEEFVELIQNIDEPEVFLDLTIHSVCQSAELRQELLETLDVYARYQRFCHYLDQRIDQQVLYRLLQGPLQDDEIGNN